MAASQSYTEETYPVAGLSIRVLKGGSGDPLVVLNHEIGSPGWLEFHEELARHFTVYLPTHPGYDGTQRPEWMRSVRDLAAVHQWLLRDLNLTNVSLLGLGFGGWIAAEMATQAPSRFRRLILVDAMGLLPREGEIMDQALYSYLDYVLAGFAHRERFDRVYGADPTTEQLELWDINREMTFRIAWKPYMYSQTLPHLLPGVQEPTLVVWGAQDRVVPLDCGRWYAELIPNARLEVVDDCGHFAGMDQPAEVARRILAFVEAN